MRAALALILAALLAGCAGEPEVSRVGDHVHGGFHQCSDGTRLDPGDFDDHHEDGFDIASKCPQPGEPARIGIDGPERAVAYETIDLAWDITPAKQGHHVQRTELRLTGIDGETDVIAKEGSSMVPRTFRTQWMPLEPGAYRLQAWASVEGEEVLSQRATIEVGEVSDTGVTHDVRITAAGPLSTIEPAGLRIAPGDAVEWNNEDVVAVRIVLDGAQPADFEVPAQESRSIVLHRLGTHTYTVTSPAFDGQGTVNVALG